MTKQVQEAATSTTDTAGNQQQQSNLFMSVDTYNSEGKTIGDRIVDLYHFGTRKWMEKHQWWAMHNGHTVEINVASDDQIKAYLAAGTEALAAKFNKATATT